MRGKNPVVYSVRSQASEVSGFVIETERFSGKNVSYRVNEKDYINIYGLTLAAKKDGGIRTELWIRRILNKNADLPQVIDELIITAQLLRDEYEQKYFGMFCITVKRLVLTSDETNLNRFDTVIGPLRYYVSGNVSTEVFTSGNEMLV